MGLVVAGSCVVPLLLLPQRQRRPWLGDKYGYTRPGNGEMEGFGKRRSSRLRIAFGASSSLCNPTDDPILKEMLKEPVAFLGGMFAGLLRLDLNEEPLKEWVTRTVEASGIKEDIDVEGGRGGGGGGADDDQAPQQILIE